MAKGSSGRGGAGRRRPATGASGGIGAARPWLPDLFHEAPVGIACLDPQGVLVACNAAFRALFGDGQDGLVGRHLADLVARPDRDDLARQFSKLVLGTARSVRLENIGVEATGDRAKRVTLVAAPLGEPGDVRAVAVYALGETARGASAAALAQAQKMQALGQLAGGVAHDFNNLLAAMLGFCDLLLTRHGAGDASHEDLLQIRGNALRAGNLVRQLLAFSRQQTLAPVRLAVHRALAELSGMLSRLLGPTIELVVDVGGDAFVEVDPGQFDQVIVNLAVNARDAMPGGGRLILAAAVVDVDRAIAAGDEIMPAGRWVRIDVSDSGSGIAKEILGNIFEPFFTTKDAGEGTGLGLATVFGIVRQTGGYLFVDSALGEGSTFTIYLPAVPVLATPPSAGTEAVRAEARTTEAAAPPAPAAADALPEPTAEVTIRRGRRRPTANGSSFSSTTRIRSAALLHGPCASRASGCWKRRPARMPLTFLPRTRGPSTCSSPTSSCPGSTATALPARSAANFRHCRWWSCRAFRKTPSGPSGVKTALPASSASPSRWPN